jgi:predicted transcriptional regulator
LNPDEQRIFSNRAKLIIASMEDPVHVMINEIKRINDKKHKKTHISLKRRSKMEIKLDIIQVVMMRPCRPTHIMKMANISYSELKLVLESLEKQGLLRSEETYTGKFYHVTNDALEILNEYQHIKERMSSED